MEKWMDKLRAINDEWNDLPRRLLWIIAMVCCLLLAIGAFRYVAPFVLAALFAWVLNPVVSFFTRRFGEKKAVRNIVSAVCVVLLAALLLTITLLLVGRVFSEIKALALAMPSWISTTTSDIIAWVEGLEFEWAANLEATIEETLLRLLADLASMLTSLATRIASTVARVAWSAASMLPQSILFIVLTLMGTFYMSADRERIFSFLRQLLPEKYRERSNIFRASILRAMFGQLRSALIMLWVTFAELSIGFIAMRMDYAILLAIAIALLDALPVIGAGLFLIPMCLYGVVFGNVTLAVGSGLIYLATIIVRQLLEPRIIGRQLGLYPLATMMAMYAGLMAMGVLGMILGPTTLLICKVALTVDPDNASEAATHKPLFKKLSRKKDKPESK